jgi:hypothetical protein
MGRHEGEWWGRGGGEASDLSGTHCYSYTFGLGGNDDVYMPFDRVISVRDSAEFKNKLMGVTVYF